jgi:hypothetical protein
MKISYVGTSWYPILMLKSKGFGIRPDELEGLHAPVIRFLEDLGVIRSIWLAVWFRSSADWNLTNFVYPVFSL